MLNITAFGEALIDMIPDYAGDSAGGAPPRAFVPYPGGAPANVAVATARLDAPTWFIGQVGQDIFGDMIAQTLAQQGVHTDYLARSEQALTPLAFVAHDADGERRFSFYRNGTADLLYRPEQAPAALFERSGVFHICSNTLTEPGIETTTHALLERAAERGCLRSVDVNFRASLWPRPEQASDAIWRCLVGADIVKMSREELDALYGETGEQAIVEALLTAGVRVVVITDGGNPVNYATARDAGEISPPPVSVIDTTAAGDAFVGGLLTQLARALDTAAGLDAWLADEGNLRDALIVATRCGAFAAGRYGAYAALPTPADIL
jgi:fructokinase